MKQIIRRVAALVVGLGLGAVALAGLETVTHISDLNASWPLGSDLASTSDDHIRNIKSALKTDFPNFNGTYTSASAPVFAIPNDTNTGMYGPSADNLAFATGGTQRVLIGSSGNVTVNAPASGSPLTINGVAGGGGFLSATGASNGAITADISNTNTGTSAVGYFRASNSADSAVFGIASTGYTGPFFTSGPTGEQAILGIQQNLPLSIGTNNTERIRVAGAGNVTINAPSSGAPLTINGTTGASGFIAGSVSVNNAITSDFTNSSTGASADSYMRFANSTDTMSIGIASTGFTGPFFTGGPSGEQGFIGGSGNFPLSIGTNNTERIRVSGAGIVQYTSSTQPFFNAQRITSTQTLTNSAVSDLVFNSANTNQGSNYSTSTGIFTAPVAGIYTFNVTVDTTTSGGLTNSINAIYISKNNATAVGSSRYDIAIGQVPSSQGSGITWRWSGSVTVALAASDTIRVKFDNGAGTGGTIVLNLGAFFSGYLLG